jgi:hypothetical protein
MQLSKEVHQRYEAKKETNSHTGGHSTYRRAYGMSREKEKLSRELKMKKSEYTRKKPTKMQKNEIKKSIALEKKEGMEFTMRQA